ncbi:MAG: CRISPR-associated helicase Cas3' [Thermoprotei archaeon]
MGVSEAYLEVKAYLDKQGFHSQRPFIDHVIDLLEKYDPSKSLFINAPTGYGKTFISMSIALDEYKNGYKSIIAYPLRSLIEDQKVKFERFMDWKGLKEIVGYRYMGNQSSPYLIHPVTLTTIDTLSLVALGLSPEDTRNIINEIMGTNYGSLGHYMFSWSSVYTSTIILDEVHLLYDSSKSLSFLASLIKINKDLENKLVFMSATIPEKFIEKLKIYSGNLIYEKFDKTLDPNFFQERKEKNYKIEILKLTTENKLNKIKELIEKEDFNKALIVFNTVEDAVNFYKLIQGRKILIHSRFSLEDREEKVKEIKNLREKAIIIGTQAIEAGIDISSDLIISDIAPPNSLIQRFGRFLRQNEKKGKAYIWYEENILNDEKERYYKVYDKKLVIDTLNYLEKHSDNINLHIDYDDFLNNIYKDEPEIDNKIIGEILNTMFNLTDPTKSAFKLLLQLEGSIIRDGNLFIAITENGIKVPVNFPFLKQRCINCPKDEKEALLRSLKGEEFPIKGYYDKEIGVI